MPSLTPSTITLSAFHSILSRYPSTVPQALQELDTQRYETIPAALKGRKSQDSKTPPSLEKDELERLVEWKLKHGTFRPKLLHLVRSNPASTIHTQTSESFSLLDLDKPSPSSSSSSSSSSSPLPALKSLIKLKGIGPATASLVLSVYAPATVPFFSDELFRWVMWGEEGDGQGKGWKRRIKYNVKEYEEVVRRVGVLRERFGGGVGAVDVERVAWVLGREGVDVGEGDEEARKGEQEEVDDEGSGEEERSEAYPVIEEKTGVKASKGGKAGVKRKAGVKVAVEGVRRSTRRKTEG